MNHMDALRCQAALVLQLKMKSIPEVKTNNQGQRAQVGKRMLSIERCSYLSNLCAHCRDKSILCSLQTTPPLKQLSQRFGAGAVFSQQ